VKEDNPSSSQVRWLDTNVFRWLIDATISVKQNRPPHGNAGFLSRIFTIIAKKHMLGNISVPVYAHMSWRNLAEPVELSGVVTTRRRMVSRRRALSSLSADGNRIFDGFTNNPGDYDDDTTVVFEYEARDCYGRVASGRCNFYGKSIIEKTTVIFGSMLDPQKLVTLNEAVRDLIEMGLLDLVPSLPGGIGSRGGRAIHGVSDRSKMGGILNKMRSNQNLQSLIHKAVGVVVKNNTVQNKISKEQKSLLREREPITGLLTHITGSRGSRYSEALEATETAGRRSDLLAIDVIAGEAIKSLRRSNKVKVILKRL
jgi:hypothetical protein